MERQFSVDDLVQGVWKVSGFPRADSEAAFQEFLRRIPSSTNLAAANQLLADQQGASTSSGLLDGPSLGNGIPRVPSLDFLRQLVVNQHPTSNGGASSGNGLKQQHGGLHHEGSSASPGPYDAPLPRKGGSMHPYNTALGHMGLPALSPSDLASLQASGLTASGLTAALQAVPGFTTHMAHGGGSSGAGASLQLGQLSLPMATQMTQRMTTSNSSDGGGGGNVKESSEKAELRRARRMLSNRESARRSRRRKQEHLGKLEEEIGELAEQRRFYEDKLHVAERHKQSVEDENKRMREEIERLRDELRFLRSEITDRKDRGYYNRRDDHDHQRNHHNNNRDDDSPPPPAKRNRAPGSAVDLIAAAQGFRPDGGEAFRLGGLVGGGAVGRGEEGGLSRSPAMPLAATGNGRGAPRNSAKKRVDEDA